MGAKEGWLVYRRVASPRRSFARVYARASASRVQFYRNETELEVLPSDGSPDDWESSETECGKGCSVKAEVVEKICQVYSLIDDLCILAGRFPQALLCSEPNQYMLNRTDGITPDPQDADAEAAAVAEVVAKLTELRALFKLPADQKLVSANFALKRIAVKLGFFHLLAGLINLPIESISEQAQFACLTMTLLSTEIADKAAPVVPPALKIITSEIDVAVNSSQWYFIFNLIKSPNVLRTLLGAGFPNFCVRLIRRCWVTLGHPGEMASTETGFKDGLSEEDRTKFVRLEKFCTHALFTLMAHDNPDVTDALKVSGAVPVLKAYSGNLHRDMVSVVICKLSLMETDPPQPDEVKYLMSPWVSLMALDGETVLSAMLSRYRLACLKLPEPWVPPNTTYTTLARYYDPQEVAPAMLAAVQIPEARSVILKSSCIKDTFAALTRINEEASRMFTTNFFVQRALVKVLSSLSFEEAAVEAIRQTPSAFDILKALAVGENVEGEDDGLLKPSDKTTFHRDLTSLIFRVFPDQAHEIDVSQRDQRSRRVSVTLPEDETQHCMISYCWADQAYVLKTAKSLREKGINVWLDVDNMSGSTLEAMASAVENSYAVIIVLSEAYKQSTACRTEAEYAYTLKKPVVPIKFDETFNASGWLGALMGTKLWFNLGGLTEDQYKEKVHAVYTELKRVTNPRASSFAISPAKSNSTTSAREAAVSKAASRAASLLAEASPPSATVGLSNGADLDTLESSIRAAVSEIFAKARRSGAV